VPTVVVLLASALSFLAARFMLRDGKRAEDIYVGPARRERRQDRDRVILNSDTLAAIMRSLN